MKFNPKMKTDKTRKSKIHEQHNPYKFQSDLGRDLDETVRNRRGDFGKNPQPQDDYPTDVMPARHRTIGIG